MGSTRDRLLRPLVGLRDWTSRLQDIRRRRKVTLAELQQLSPVFVIGANRSGTSVVSAILSQHDDLEGLFGDDGTSRTDNAGHSIGFAESMHVWMALQPDASARRRSGQLPYWALPQYVNQAYRNCARNDSERFDLAWSLARLRRTREQPILKDQYNTLRVGLIADVFPRARFVLVTRGFASFATRGLDKWRNHGLGTRLSPDDPRAGLHWHLANLIARYDLEAYAAGRYGEVCLDALHAGRDEAEEEFRAALEAIDLAPFAFDFRLLESQWSKPRKEYQRIGEGAFDSIRQIVNFERELLGQGSQASVRSGDRQSGAPHDEGQD